MPRASASDPTDAPSTEFRRRVLALFGSGFVCAGLFFASNAAAQDNQLAAVRSTLVPLRAHREERRDTRGATSELTTAKHQLRDWIESRLSKFANTGDPDTIADEFNATLRESQMFCEEECLATFFLGYLSDVKVSRERDYLVVQTSLGIYCGYDESAYVYQWTNNRWQRVFETEQNVYTAKGYAPQTIHAVHISLPGKDGERLLLTLGSKPGCASAFQPVYSRVWRLDARHGSPKLLLQTTEVGYMGRFPPVKGRVAPDDLLIELSLGGIGYGLSHQVLRHYEIRGDKVKQVDPTEPTPRDFVEEWLDAPWKQAAERSESAALKEWHDKLHRDDGLGDDPDPALHCSNRPELWQVGIERHDQPQKTYYMVRWRTPYRFSMVAVSNQTDPGCTEKDAKPEGVGTLFPDE